VAVKKVKILKELLRHLSNVSSIASGSIAKGTFAPIGAGVLKVKSLLKHNLDDMFAGKRTALKGKEKNIYTSVLKNMKISKGNAPRTFSIHNQKVPFTAAYVPFNNTLLINKAFSDKALEHGVGLKDLLTHELTHFKHRKFLKHLPTAIIASAVSSYGLGKELSKEKSKRSTLKTIIYGLGASLPIALVAPSEVLAYRSMNQYGKSLLNVLGGTAASSAMHIGTPVAYTGAGAAIGWLKRIQNEAKKKRSNVNVRRTSA